MLLLSNGFDKWLGSITLYEAAQIWAQFTSYCEPHKMVLWSGIEFDQAESWARSHGRKTLTQAMGPLMEKSNPNCRYNIKNIKQWLLYVHAASILFALYISKGHEVVVLTRHPPQRFNPCHESYYQNIEEPWLTACCDDDNFKFLLAHPEIDGAGEHIYQYWPVDRVGDWISRFPHPKVTTRPWPHHSWGSKISEYQPRDLRRERTNIMEKLYLYKTGVSIYWGVANLPDTARISLSTKKLRKVCNKNKVRKEGNIAPADASTSAQRQKSGNHKARTKPASKTPIPANPPKRKKYRKKKKSSVKKSSVKKSSNENE